MGERPTAPNGIILFNYPVSPFGRRVSWYLALRGIGYALCEQPFIMPRPDLEKLGLKYRRIPILTIGRDVYLDTRLIIRKLEEKFPDGKLGSEKPEEVFVEKLLEKYMVEGPVFSMATGLVPAQMMNDAKVMEDRKGFCGRDWTRESLEQGRPECLVYVRNLFDFLETTILADGRKWILNSAKPSLADIEAIWPMDWLVGMEGAVPSHVVSEKHFPKVYAWIHRFRAALDEAQSAAPGTAVLDGDEAVNVILQSSFSEGTGTVDQNDGSGLKAGTEVELYPADWGSEHRDVGQLVALGPDEVTVEAKGTGGAGAGAAGLRIHGPRTGFRVTEMGGST
ncbi:glutathione S-transferase [Massarina eburnea CBS 473.64]|uniref:Glutathione S-transferase n=1 Tax=Massarina eburnea CBS 473.64 TaxID=1395130 RepID=A0A6A6SEC9_9PLEO|nr:glutathione S-transferase [Massarina eburnea CBS 473.64]